MANRFTATEKWIDPWFCELNEKDKLFWIYLVDNCDHAGMWQVNWPLVRFHIKDYNFDEKVFNGRVVKIKENKWFIPKFIEFQYKTGLNPDNRAHLSVINILKKEGAYKGLTRGLQARKDMDIVKDKVNRRGMGEKFDEVWGLYPNKVGRKEALRHFEASVNTDKDLDDIKVAIENYKQSKRFKEGYIQNGSTFFNDWHGWVNQIPPKVDPLAKWEVKK